ncbi:MAG: ferredoxin [Synergistaceae bacterium]|jgi:ferredoxin|nr:ferredoxin [Synergistaceae bacterium]
MIIRINLNDCIGCGVCSHVCPENFALDDEKGLAYVISQDYTPLVKEAIDSCPVSAIAYS